MLGAFKWQPSDAFLRRGSHSLDQNRRGHYAAANSIFSISAGSSASAFELLTRFETGQRCRKSFATGFRIPAPASPLSVSTDSLFPHPAPAKLLGQ